MLFGINYIAENHFDYIRKKQYIDFIELQPDSFICNNGIKFYKQLLELRNEFEFLTAHSLNLSIFSKNMDLKYIDNLKTFMKQLEIKDYSDHVSLTKGENAHFPFFVPPEFNDDMLRQGRENIAIIRNIFQDSVQSISFENIPDIIFYKSNQEYDEQTFTGKFITENNLEFTLNISNLHISSILYKCDPIELLNRYPIENMKQVVILPVACLNNTIVKYYNLNDEDSIDILRSIIGHYPQIERVMWSLS